ncbi:V-type proton ATPase subunit S1 [Planococcus citri]|uniref:V-type proton ATPase subunit S1 n=1 Tax=Planococcus citri TaxID=170843 RepID=UPI0031F97301
MISLKLLTVLATLGVAYSQNAAAPVLIWGNHHSIDKMTSNMGKISANNIEDWIMKPSTENEDTRVVVGILESFSLPDLFKKYGDESVFSNVQSSMGDSKYKNFFVQTNGLSKRIHDAADESVSGVQNLVATSDSKKIHVIKITPKGENLAETLKMSDNIMHKACKEYASLYKSYICVMTGSSDGQETDHVRIARSLLQTNEPAAEVKSETPMNIYFSPGFALIYTKTTPVFWTVVDNQSRRYNLTKIGETTKSEKTLFVYFQDKANSSPKIRLAFTFINESSTWSLEQIGYGDGAKNQVIMKPSIKISSSFGNSFHTPSKVVFRSDDLVYNLTFNSLQVEFTNNPKTLQTMRFNAADDTVYFFTIPILSGLFVTSLLVTIVLLGLSMIFDIKTMDLFDDPKGKTVTINASE